MLRLFFVAGRSMTPVVPDQALVVVRPIKEEPQPGDIVVYRQPWAGFPVVHRLGLQVAGDWLLQGDANTGPDPLPVPLAAMYGRVWLIFPRLGKFLKNILAGMALWKR